MAGRRLSTHEIVEIIARYGREGPDTLAESVPQQRLGDELCQSPGAAIIDTPATAIADAEKQH